MPFTGGEEILLDAGLFIGALLKGDSRHVEAREIVEAARSGIIKAATTTGILCEVYAALTWHLATPPQLPSDASSAVQTIVEAPSQIRLLPDSRDAFVSTMRIAAKLNLTARRIHDARHAATAIQTGIEYVCTYDETDWSRFEPEGIAVVKPSDMVIYLRS